MADAIKFQTIDKFLGINTVDDPTRLAPVMMDYQYIYPLQQANNLDIDNTYGLSSRSGYDDILLGLDMHSLSNDAPGFFVDGDILKKLNTDYSIISLRFGLTLGARMSYVLFNDRTYYTNGYEIGYIKNDISTLLADPLLEFKLPLPAGQLIEYFMGCLYVAVNDILYISDPLCDYYDTRTGYRRFAGRITMLRAVDDGLYVSDDRIWFIKGKTNEDFERSESYSSRAIPFTDERINGRYISDNLSGNVAIWTGENGICVGDNRGVVINLTESKYVLPVHGNGAGFIRDKDNIRHYVVSLY